MARVTTKSATSRGSFRLTKGEAFAVMIARIRNTTTSLAGFMGRCPAGKTGRIDYGVYVDGNLRALFEAPRKKEAQKLAEKCKRAWRGEHDVKLKKVAEIDYR